VRCQQIWFDSRKDLNRENLIKKAQLLDELSLKIAKLQLVFRLRVMPEISVENHEQMLILFKN
jgi:hypothetical protein